MKLSFHGAAQTVTGSKYLLETKRARLMIDCGLFQGVKTLRLRNWADLDFDLKSLDAVVLTHAHIDHSGYLPRLRKCGFRGPVYCTPGTRQLLSVLLPDSGYLQEEQAKHANRYGYSKHHPAMPLYTREEAQACLSQLRPIQFDTPFVPGDGFAAEFSWAGHIVGSACVRLEADGKSVTFSGDVGRPNDPIMRAPASLKDTDVLVVESTYGDRRHPEANIADELADVLNPTIARGGAAVIPAFAVGRSQHISYLISKLREAGRIPDVPVFLDSPMAISATQIFLDNPSDHGISPEECARMDDAVRYVHTPDESKSIDVRSDPLIVISASGMATGGRVLHHLRRFLPEAENSVILVGFQAAGTRGQSLAQGAEEIKIFGDYVPVRAQVSQLSSLSAHADYAELIAWLERSAISPQRVFVTHGEACAADAFRRRLFEHFGWEASVPTDGSSYEF